MGIFDDDDDLLGGLLDFDGDGKTSLDEEFMGYLAFEEMTSPDDESDASEEPAPTYVGGGGADFVDNPYSSWKDDCIEGLDFAVYPESYTSLSDYLDALAAVFNYQTNFNFNFINSGCDSEFEFIESVKQEIEDVTGISQFDYVILSDYFNAANEYFDS